MQTTARTPVIVPATGTSDPNPTRGVRVNVLTAVSTWMRKLANWKALLVTGALFAVSAAALFASNLAFAIPSVTDACGQPPPDMRFFTSGDQVHQFLTDCGWSGRAAYENMQIADLFYPTISGLFLACAIAIALTGLIRPDSRVIALAAIPLVGSIFDYLENAAAWVTMTTYPQDSGLVTDLLGVASIGKQVFTWASWLILCAAATMTAIRLCRGRYLRHTHQPVVPAEGQRPPHPNQA